MSGLPAVNKTRLRLRRHRFSRTELNVSWVEYGQKKVIYSKYKCELYYM